MNYGSSSREQSDWFLWITLLECLALGLLAPIVAIAELIVSLPSIFCFLRCCATIAVLELAFFVLIVVDHALGAVVQVSTLTKQRQKQKTRRQSIASSLYDAGVQSVLISSMAATKSTRASLRLRRSVDSTLVRNNDVPRNYIEKFGSSGEQARQAWARTKMWRDEAGISGMIEKPRPQIAEVKTIYPFYIHGHSKDGYAVIYEKIGGVAPSDVFAVASPEELLRNYLYCLEYLGSVLSEKPALQKAREGFYGKDKSSWGMIYVMDFADVKTVHLKGEMLRVRTRALDLHNKHYPGNLKRVTLINVPRWVVLAFGGLQGNSLGFELEMKTGSQYQEALQSVIDVSDIPSEYGGDSKFALDQHPYEHEFRAIAKNGLQS